jgi:predicted metalloprotease
MRWEDLPESGNVEDRRDESGGGGGGGGFGMPMGAGGMSIGTVVVLGLIGWALGIDPSLLIGGAEILTRDQPQVQEPSRPRQTGAPKDDSGRFVARVLGSTEATWKDIFAKDGKTYRAPVLVIYRGVTEARCGGAAQAAMGPFYCPNDQKIYLDTSFFNEIETRFRGCSGKACEFSQAYVIAHEVGHHVQNQLGVLPRAQTAQRAAGDRVAANRIQVQVELQADCFAGIWANKSNERWNLLQPGDVEAALRTAAAIGDDTLQRRSQGRVVPDSFTHGSAEQRQRWFNTGLKSGTVASCNTFAATQL